MKFKMLAPAFDRTYTTQQYDVENAPHDLVRVGASVALGVILLGIVATIAAIPLGFQLTVWYPELPWTVLPVLVGAAVVLLAVVKFVQFGNRAKQAIIDGYATYLRIQRLHAEARLAEAQAVLKRATPPIIAEQIRTVPVVTSHIEPEQPINKDVPVEPVPTFWNGTKVRADDLRYFIVHSLPPDFKHSRRSWLMRDVKDRTLPSGKVINDQVDYDEMLNILVQYKLIVNRGDGSTGDWTVKDVRQIYKALGLDQNQPDQTGPEAGN